MAKDLRSFLQAAKRLGPDFYVEAGRPLDPMLEVSVLQWKLAKEGRYPVVYCPEVEGSEFPLVTNLFASYGLLGLALDLDPQTVSRSMILPEYRARESARRPTLMVEKREAPVKEVVATGDEIDLGALPVTHHGQLDSGKYLTLACTICRDPDTGIPNAGVYRMEVKGRREVSLMSNPSHDFSYIARRHAELGKKMEVVVAIGHHPAMIMGSLAKGQGVDMNELEVMGGLLAESLRVVPAETVDLPVPADAEIVLEGVIDPTTRVTDGPFGEFTGYYGEKQQPAWRIDLTAITQRKDAIYLDLTPGHREHALAVVLSSEANAYDMVKRVVPSVKAVHLPPYAACFFHMFISIDKRIPGEGKSAALAGCVAEPNVKFVVVVDEDIDVYDEQEVLWAMATRAGSDRNITLINDIMGSHLDPSARDEAGLAGGTLVTKVIVDATLPVEGPHPRRMVPPKEVWDRVSLVDYLR
jgi:2,5-furandicarboxylate decarboxylase 1